MLPATVIPSSLSTCPNRRLASRIDQRAGCCTPSRSTPSRAPLRPTTSPTLRVPVTARQPRGRRSSDSCSPSSPSASTFTFLKKRITTVSMSRGRPAPPGRQAQERHKPKRRHRTEQKRTRRRHPSLTRASRAPACRGHCPAACRPSPRPRRRRPTGRTLTCGGNERKCRRDTSHMGTKST